MKVVALRGSNGPAPLARLLAGTGGLPGPAPSSRHPANSAIFSPGEHRIGRLAPFVVIRSPGGHLSRSLAPVTLGRSSPASSSLVPAGSDPGRSCHTLAR